MIPQEVKDFIKRLIKEAISDELGDLTTKIHELNAKLDNLETDLLIQKEGENI